MRNLLFLLFLAACDDFATVQKQDTIEAYEGWLKENGESGAQAITALARLEDLYQKRANETKRPADYRVFLDKFPKAKARAEMIKGLETALFDEAESAGTEAGWQAFLDGCKECDPRKRELAQSGIQAAKYSGNLKISEVRTEPVNLAEDPKGPKNGIGFFADVTNTGDKTLSLLWMNLVFSDAAGKPVGRFDGPVAAPQTTSRMPIRPQFQQPLKAGETRTFRFTTETPPEGAVGAPKLIPARLKIAE
jgi:hypothetical protein